VSSWRKVLGLLALVGLMESGKGATLVVRGSRGPIVPNNTSRLLKPRTMRGAPNLIFFNGGIFERTRSGVRPLKIDKRTFRLIGARSSDTAKQLARVLAPNLKRFSGDALRVLSNFVRRNFDPSQRLPTTSRNPTRAADASGADSRKKVDKDGGQHGQGSRVDTSARSRAATGSSEGGGACSDLSAAICNSADAQNSQRRAEGEKGATVREFIRQARLSGESFGEILQGVLNQPQRFLRSYSAFTSFLSGKLGADARSALAQARTALLTALESQDISPEAKIAMRDKLSSVKFRLTPDFRDLRSVQAFIANCGPEGMGDGAFAAPSVGEVVVCPGILFGAAGKGGELVNHLIHVVAHEMGHHVGADPVPESSTGFGSFKPIYGPMESCYRTNFKVSPAKFGEIAADTWGVEAIAAQLRGKSKTEAIQFLSDAFAPLCGTEGSEVHPSGNFRINATLARNPRIREAIGCDPPTSERPGCTLSGTEPKE